MADKSMSQSEYFKTVLLDLAKEFYMQRAEGVRFRTILAARDYFKDVHDKVIVPENLEQTLEKIKEELPKTGLFDSIDFEISRKDLPEYSLEGYLVKAIVHGCVHLPEGLPEDTGHCTFLCPFANLMAWVLEDVSTAVREKETEIVSMEPKTDGCDVQVVLTKGLSSE